MATRRSLINAACSPEVRALVKAAHASDFVTVPDVMREFVHAHFVSLRRYAGPSADATPAALRAPHSRTEWLRLDPVARLDHLAMRALREVVEALALAETWQAAETTPEKMPERPSEARTAPPPTDRPTPALMARRRPPTASHGGRR